MISGEFTADLAVLVGLVLTCSCLVWTCFCLVKHWRKAIDRRSWLYAIAAMLLIEGTQITDLMIQAGVIADDRLFDLPMMLGASWLLYRVLQRARGRPWTVALWRIGFAAQIAYAALDLNGGRLIPQALVAPERLAAWDEWTELLYIGSYIAALVLFEVFVRTRRASVQPHEIGAEARRVFTEGQLLRTKRYPSVAAAYWPGLQAPFLLATCLWLLARVGPIARAASGRSLRAQFADLLALSVGRGFDPKAYYFQELYRQSRCEADCYLTRFETKNGLMYALNRLRVQPYSWSEMHDKLRFAELCEAAGLAAVPVLVSIDGGAVRMRVRPVALDRDLWSKPRTGRGAAGAALYERIAPLVYRMDGGEELHLAELVARWSCVERERSFLVQPRLANHPEIADLADASLITVRVVTCLDSDAEPQVTHGLLRILGKLEPTWPSRDEWASPIDLETGTLGAMRSDRIERCAETFQEHPIKGTRIVGRVVPNWKAIVALTRAAHSTFAHRTVVGWDVAVTAEGPVLLEGNNSFDVMFPQRVYGEGFGSGPLGPLLLPHLDELARRRGVD